MFIENRIAAGTIDINVLSLMDSPELSSSDDWMPAPLWFTFCLAGKIGLRRACGGSVMISNKATMFSVPNRSVGNCHDS
jgi:hypothetical protein